MEEFRLPQSQAEAVYKLSENVYEFIGNYLVIGVVCVVCVLCAPAACPHAASLRGAPPPSLAPARAAARALRAARCGRADERRAPSAASDAAPFPAGTSAQ